MKKIIAMLFASVFFTSQAMADLAIGVSVSAAAMDTSGSETEMTGDTETNSKTHEENIVAPAIFVEAVADNNFVLGLSYIPARELGSGSRTDVNTAADVASEADTGTYSVDVELENVVQVYTNIPIGPVYALLGVQSAQITVDDNDKDNQNNYENVSVLGYTLGAGYRGELGGAFYKAEVSYTDFDNYSDISRTNDKKVTADTEVTAFTVAMGVQF